MEITTRQAYDVLVVDMVGRLDSKTAGYGNDEMVKIVQGDCKKILVNLENLEFVTSAGLRVLLVAAKLLQTAKGQFKLCCANEAVEQVLETCGFKSLLQLYPTEAAAIKSF
jgi:anti-sigma B factor antagonist